MKKVIVILTIFVLSVSLIGCKKTVSEDSNEIHVGVSFFPMKEILTLIEDDLKEEGYELKIDEFSDYQTPNNLLKDNELDANMIQHDYFLQSFNKANSSDLVTIQPLYHAVFALYSKEYNTIEDLPSGVSVTVPDDVTEGYVISLVSREDNKDSAKIKALIKHIISDKVRQFLIDEYSWASSPAF